MCHWRVKIMIKYACSAVRKCITNVLYVLLFTYYLFTLPLRSKDQKQSCVGKLAIQFRVEKKSSILQTNLIY